MKSLLRILHLEDDSNDAALVQTVLAAGGIACVTTQVQTRKDFLAALEHGEVDLILSDCSLPTFDGLSAAEMVREQWPDIPFIFVSGTLGEERAVESLKKGATDYVLKDRLARLVPAVTRAMEEVKERVERRKVEAQFIEAQKMEVVGQLAGGVAHDFNNILAVIMGYGDLLKEQLSSQKQLQEYAEEILQASERATALTQQLLLFSRKQTVHAVVLDLNVEVQQLHKMLRRLLNQNVELDFALANPLGRTKADPGQVGQVLMNLVVNARDAMPNGGQITVRTGNITIDANSVADHPGAAPGDYVMLSVSDTGTGITDEVRAHMFEPFFTTKPLGKGTGLGLATCQTIAQQSGGHIGVSSAMGKGTTFTVYFPRVEQQLDVAVKPAQNAPLPRGTETLLVVEDEPSVRNLARSILETQGYEVLQAANGEDALAVARAQTGKAIHLIITDVMMPLMGGEIMAKSLQSTHPEIKILFTSGYTDDTVAHHGLLEPGVAFLPKPYTPTTLARKVRAMLDNKTDTSIFRIQEQTAPQSRQPID